MERFRRFVKEHHALYVLYWPVYVAVWIITEKLAVGKAFIIHSAVDDVIPFCEFFTLIYFLWYPFWILMMLYCFISEPETFRRMSLYFILTYTVCSLAYVFLPTAVNFQPTTFERDNIFVDMTRVLYYIDEPTNVCPSEHVVGALAVVFAALDTKRFRSAKWVVPISIMAVLISLSILFTKQHSFWDLVAAVPLSVLGWLVCYRPWRKRETAPDK